LPAPLYVPPLFLRATGRWRLVFTAKPAVFDHSLRWVNRITPVLRHPPFCETSPSPLFALPGTICGPLFAHCPRSPEHPFTGRSRAECRFLVLALQSVRWQFYQLHRANNKTFHPKSPFLSVIRAPPFPPPKSPPLVHPHAFLTPSVVPRSLLEKRLRPPKRRCCPSRFPTVCRRLPLRPFWLPLFGPPILLFVSLLLFGSPDWLVLKPTSLFQVPPTLFFTHKTRRAPASHQRFCRCWFLTSLFCAPKPL